MDDPRQPNAEEAAASTSAGEDARRPSSSSSSSSSSSASASEGAARRRSPGGGNADGAARERPQDEALVESFLKCHDRWTSWESALRRMEEDTTSDDAGPEPPEAVGAGAILVDAMRAEAAEFARDLSDMEEEEGRRDDGNVSSILNRLPTAEEWARDRRPSAETSGPRPQPQQEEIGQGKKTEGDSENSDLSPHCTPPPVTLEELSELLFRPGMKFRGRICVPGLGNVPRNDDEDIASQDDDDSFVTVPDGSESGDGNDINSNTGNSSSNNNNAPSPRRPGGNADDDPRTYELVVLERGKDALGNGYIMATHSAYDDEQCVDIRVKITEGESSDCADAGGNDRAESARLEVEYADGETCCFGKWNPKEFRFEGHVRQRLRANDGVFHTSDDVTHVFTLYPCTARFPKGRRLEPEGEASGKTNVQQWHSTRSQFERDILSRDSKAIVAHRHRTFKALGLCFQHFLVLFQVVRITSHDMQKVRIAMVRNDVDGWLDARQRLIWRLRDCGWTDLLAESCRHAGERLCANFRSRAAILDEVSFETKRDREDFMERWQKAKMDLADAHSEWESRQFLLNALAKMVYAFDSERGMLLSLAIMHRLHASYECLESAYRRARARIPGEELAAYEVRPGQEGGLDGSDCIICQSPLTGAEYMADGDLERLYKLPCGHCFHEKCVQKWLHDHDKCPVCRYHLTRNNAK